MKVLIVDDEKHVREGIRLLADWEAFDIGEIREASNGEEAVQIINEYKPEIIFSDMKMPKMDGTKLLEWIKEHMPTSKTIVVTGYDDYQYMRKAIHYGSSDYLLKPVDPEILNATLERVVQEWKKEELERKSKADSYQLINKMKPVYRDRRLTYFVNNKHIEAELLEELGFHLAASYAIAVIPISEKVMEEFSYDRDLAYFSVLNIINELLMEKKCGIGFRYLANKGEIVVIFWDRFEDIQEYLNEIYIEIKKSFAVSCPIGLGPVEAVDNLLHSYHEGKKILLESNVLEDRELRVYTKNDNSNMELKSLMAYSSAIKLAVQAGEAGAFDELIHQIKADYIQEGYLSVRQLERFEQEYLLISNRWYKDYNIPINSANVLEKRAMLYFDKDGKFMLENYEHRIQQEISIFLKKVKRKQQKKNTNIICEIERYLQNNFNREIKLQEISEQFYISREYVSRKFKQEFNVNISDYIVQVRINKAKSLLKNSQLKIYEIANMVGYQDDKYFRKVFKKVMGITPNEYRDQ
ncbi:response regulator [Niallia sp. NCCP-28]|uniref:response regulator n=1 Tax=Niallia sp. NCCP-28 TaxID=2934712 RepID=UPI002089553E|nr:response regulator [Niallia sp. NCCP-28]GKU84480.1 DNA-binding response regulator [Niallia sp. NCCP-28]